MADISAVSAASDSATKTIAVPGILRTAATPEASTPRPTHAVLRLSYAQMTPGATCTGMTKFDELIHSNSFTQTAAGATEALPAGTGVVTPFFLMFVSNIANSDTEGADAAFQSEGAGGSNTTMQQSATLVVVAQ
jgi:hypothetical protein